MKTISKGGSGSSHKGINTLAGNAKRPPKVRGNVANDVFPGKPRSAVMPPPTKDERYTRKNKSCS